MSPEALAIDSSAAVDFLNPNRPTPEPIEQADRLFLPLQALGELRYGVLKASPQWRAVENERVESLAARCSLLLPDASTASFYARVRLNFSDLAGVSRRREIHLLNDLWIAALCLQHRLPLLTNDKDFEGIEGLDLVHW
jgi:tRNA(fMet)-specific endonuclease VapC